MISIFFVSVTLMWLFGFMTRISYCFKEQYKKFYDKLFDESGKVRPRNWSISRQRNHDAFAIFRLFTTLFGTIAVIFGAIVYKDIAELVVIFTVPIIVILPLGEAIGNTLCRLYVKRECKKFSVPYQKV